VQAVYLSVDVNKYIRNSLIKFRFGVSPVVVHSLRYKMHAHTDTICPLCRAAVENEVHFTLCCSVLKDLRQRLIPDKFYSQPSSFRLVLLLSTFIVQEMCESRGGRPGLSVLTSLLVSVDVKIYCTVLRHWSQLVPNMSHDI